MKVEYTGRQTTINKKLKAQAEAGLERIAKVVGRTASAHVILSEDKYRQIAEVSVVTGGHSLVATCKSAEMTTALHDALAKVEQQAIRYKKKFTTLKRHPKDDKNVTNVAAGEAEKIESPVKRVSAKKVAAKTSAARKAVSMVVHSFPSKTPLIEPHVVRSIDSAAMRPMTFEEAVKEAAFRDRDVFVFRDHANQVLILHRKRDGKVELIEVP
ncbi:ribosome hibernation-promoting factor, HPF/YfiA family [Granulicella arctica]|uniref:Ribosome hibernation promoting factor n=1 Tax=Granulicella arctica TaxID=940613 RepID=A0A7Y9PIJ0_9BACT|nr:ribosome-associated translation inhibitor RaiA [Granulicella arctica]NYF79776.1 putative sigma-54 modulation protein [Granulicella arctica]